ncbi:hypothetical protein [Lysinibacter sp. HNR]|uniref:zinc ribbon domain-containing protein n=1 Tax=Lysinibacter sp. HNR TaxID=3031408 RepID=UPI002434EE8A|nr:hypothetical protein [Lysinibacter sp. HNR]WGD38563.1 hypothetical protein FrondiHNR_06575 [Lysinibacter sp. HNR]
MKASPEQQQKLLEVQNQDTLLGQLAYREKNLPEKQALEKLQPSFLEAKEAANQARSTVEVTQAEIRRLEDDTALIRARLVRNQERLSSSASAKEAVALEDELKTLTRRTNELEEVTLIVMERLEAEEAQLLSANSQLKMLHEKQADIKKKITDALTELTAEREHVIAQREQLAQEIAPELLALYEKTRQRYGVGAALLRGRVSEASNMTLTEADLSIIRMAAPDEIVFDAGSGAILVRTAESGL